MFVAGKPNVRQIRLTEKHAYGRVLRLTLDMKTSAGECFKTCLDKEMTPQALIEDTERTSSAIRFL